VAFGNANVAKALQPTDEQHQKKVAEIKEEAMKVLTSEQASQWQYMIGSPFRGEVRLMPPWVMAGLGGSAPFPSEN
jgi:hypothetical protein